MKLKPIKTKKDYLEAIKEIEKIWDASPKTPMGDKLDILSTLVDSYESTHIEILPPDPIEAILFRMDQLGLKKSLLA